MSALRTAGANPGFTLDKHLCFCHAAAKMELDERTHERLRQVLLKKGMEIATLLADVLAGKDRERDLAALPAFTDKPGLKPEERLRLYLDHVESRRKLLVAGDERYGHCDRCGAELSLYELEEMPWADQCRKCGSGG